MSTESIVVCGTGIAGLACAAGLARSGMPVALLGPRQAPPRLGPEAWHPRVYALSPASQGLLDGLGAWRLLDTDRITPIETMEVYGDGQGVLDLSAWQDAESALAWIAESGELERALQQLVHVLGVPWHEDTLAGFDRAGSGLVLRLGSGAALSASLLVGADGGRSLVRQLAGIGHQYKPYGDMGVVAHLDAQFAHQNRAFQWFTGDSVLALLPLPDTPDGPQVSMVWSMPDGRARELVSLDADAAQAFVAGHFRAITGDRLGGLRLRSRPQGFSLTLERSGMVAPGVALVGDAAHRVHPLAGQGLNLGLGDVQTLLDVLRARGPRLGVGDPRVLARYRRARAEPVLAMGLVTDGLHRLFGARAAPLVWARNEGMRALDHLPFLKRRLIRAAAGH